jgi:hypothetical protein
MAFSLIIAGCAGAEKAPEMLAVELAPHGRTCEVVIKAPPEVGDMRLWLPEGVMSETGCSAVYPIGSEWRPIAGGYRHEVSGPGTHGPGNFIKIDDHTFECMGIRMPVDQPVRWESKVWTARDGLRFSVRLTNEGDVTIRKAAAAICLKFFHAPWWNDENVYVRSGGRIRSLAELGREAGPPDNVFQAYLLKGQAFDHAFYHQFWGINDDRLDAPVIVSENPEAGVCVELTGRHAYFLHSNKANPCTDIMLAYGDLRPGQTRERTGRIRLLQAQAKAILDRQ